MDLKLFFHKIRTIEAAIPGEHAVVVSLETPDGGRSGQLSEVTRAVAAKLIVQGKARLANEGETEGFRASLRSAAKAAAEAMMKDRVHISVLPETELELLRCMLDKKT